jgi:transcriptional regulator with XRE-family HTH domain
VKNIEIKLSLARELKRARLKKGLSQTALASKLGSSQSRVAKMEAADAPAGHPRYCTS